MNLVDFLIPDETPDIKAFLERALAERERMIGAICGSCHHLTHAPITCLAEHGKPHAVRTTCPLNRWAMGIMPFVVTLPNGLVLEMTPNNVPFDNPIVNAHRKTIWDAGIPTPQPDDKTSLPESETEPPLLGDRLKTILHKTRLDKLSAAYTRVTGKDCGCKKRQEALNEWDRNRRAKHQDSGNTAAPSKNATGPG